MNERVFFSVLFVLVLFLAAMVVLGLRSRRYNATFESSLTADRASSFFLIAASAVGAHIGSGFVVGGAEQGAGFGLGGAWYGVCCGLSFVIAGLFLGKIFRRLSCVSISEYLYQRYRNRVTPLIYSVSNIFSGFSLVAGQLLAGKVLFSAVGIDGSLGVVLMAVTAFLFVTFSGMWGVLAASALQSAIIAMGMVASLVLVTKQQGIAILIQTLPDTYFSFQPYDWETFVQLTVPTVIFAQISQFCFQRFASADSERSAVWGHVLGGALLIPLALVPALLGMYGRVLFPGVPDGEVFIHLLADHLPTALAGLLIAAILCAIISSCNSVFLLIDTCFVNDIWKEMLRPAASEKEMRRLSVICNAFTCLVGIGLTLTNDSILTMMSFAYTFMISGCLVPFFGGLIWKRPGPRAAVASAAAGIVTATLYVFDLVPIPFGSIFPVLPSLLVYILAAFPLGPFKRRSVS